MTKVVYNKQTLNIVGSVSGGSTLESEFELNVIPNFGGALEDYDVIDVPFINYELIKGDKGKVVARELEVPNVPLPPTAEERIESLEQEKLMLQRALAESIEKQEIDKVNNQIALAELIETLNIKGVL